MESAVHPSWAWAPLLLTPLLIVGFQKITNVALKSVCTGGETGIRWEF